MNIAIGLLLAIVATYVMFRCTRNGTSKFLIKKTVLPIAALAFIVFTLGACSSGVAEELELEVEKNATLSEQITELEHTNATLQEDIASLEERTEEISQLEETIEEMKAENKELSDTIETVTKENETLLDDNKKLQSELKEKEETAKAVEKSTNTTTKTASTETSSTSDSTKTEPKTEKKKEVKTEEPADCDIKGSQTGIYHVPGSTYYSRTTNVAQWFCSTQEAEDAGYRAPKR